MILHSMFSQLWLNGSIRSHLRDIWIFGKNEIKKAEPKKKKYSHVFLLISFINLVCTCSIVTLNKQKT